jgi:large subunit ribosomal protein L21
MFAVIRTGGKQYRVAKDDQIVVERLTGEPGALVEIDDVLMIGEAGKAPTLGTDELGKAAVFAEVVEQTRGEKIVVFKKHRRQGYRRRGGHRQLLTVLRIADISATGKKPAKAAAKVKEEAPKADAAAPEPTTVEEKPKAEAKPKAKPKAEAEPEATAKAETTAKPKAKPKAKAKAKADDKGAKE